MKGGEIVNTTGMHAKVLKHIRSLREKYGDCYHDLGAIAKAIGCDKDALFETENNTGVLADLEWSGDVMRIGTSFVAVGQFDWS
jgi:hypothetical protein